MKPNASHHGLTSQEVEQNRLRFGSNILTSPPAESLWHKFIDKFKDPLIIILLVAGVLSIGIACFEYYSGESGIGAFAEPLGIFIAIFLATGLAFYFEEKANREFDLLNQVNDDEPVQVIRNGMVTEVPKKEIVVGDIVILNTGNDIPADGELLEAISLTVDESTLTGEPACAKTTDRNHFDPEATFPSNSAMRGTRVIEGHGIMRVTAVGDQTENGKVFTAAQIDNNVRTPLNEQLDRLGQLISKISYILAAIIICGRTGVYLTANSFEWLPFLTVLLKSIMSATKRKTAKYSPPHKLTTTSALHS
ncbi:MAG: haloacid dehalogenase, partial [Muribaculaceae bacterium]|nr:haloacid dehalogenase [Muribaculaceae bacterium]